MAQMVGSDVTVFVRSLEGGLQWQLKLPDQFTVRPNQSALHQVTQAQQTAQRVGTHSTKTRAEVSGGGRKPFKQKGTGNARQGSTRAPHFSGGGVAHGPKPRDYQQKVNKKVVKLALDSALSWRAQLDRVVVVGEWSFDVPSTKRAKSFLERAGVDGTALVVVSDLSGPAARSFRNLPNVELAVPGHLNALRVMRNEWLVFSTDTLSALKASDLPTDTLVEAQTGGAPSAGGRTEMADYTVAERPARHFAAGVGEYLKIERYEHAMSFNWTTSRNVDVLGVLAGKWSDATVELWESARTSEEQPARLLTQLINTYPRVIRGSIASGRLVGVWRIIPRTAKLRQFGVLLPRFDRLLVEDLVRVTATPSVRAAVKQWLNDSTDVTFPLDRKAV